MLYCMRSFIESNVHPLVSNLDLSLNFLPRDFSKLFSFSSLFSLFTFSHQNLNSPHCKYPFLTKENCPSIIHHLPVFYLISPFLSPTGYTHCFCFLALQKLLHCCFLSDYSTQIAPTLSSITS